MLPMRSIFFPFIVALLRHGFIYVETYPTFQKFIFDDMDTSILRACPFIAYCVFEFKTVFLSLIFWRFLFLPQIAPNKNTCQI